MSKGLILMVKCVSIKLGNAYVIHIGQVEIAKFWFEKKGESHSILSEEEAKSLANDMASFFNQKYDMSKLDDKVYKESDEEMVKLLSKMAELID